MSGADRGKQSAIGLGLMLMSFSSGCMDILRCRFLGDVFTSAMTAAVILGIITRSPGRARRPVRRPPFERDEVFPPHRTLL